MKTAERTSRFGRPQKETTQDAGVIPTEVAKFVSKHSPKRLKPKEIEKNVSDVKVEKTEKMQQPQTIPYEDKENEFISETLKPSQKPEVSERKSTLESMDMVEDESEKNKTITDESESVPVQSEVKQLKSELSFGKCEVAPPTVIFQEFTKDENQNDSKNVALDDEKVKQDFSDTDSALGSATSCNNEVKGITNRAYFAGQMLWGSFNGTSWFPCMAYPFDDEGNVVAGKKLTH